MWKNIMSKNPLIIKKMKTIFLLLPIASLGFINTDRKIFYDEQISNTKPTIQNNGESLHIFKNYYSLESGAEEFRFSLKVDDNANHDFYEEATTQTNWTITIAYSNLYPFNGYESGNKEELETNITFLEQESEIYKDEYVFSADISSINSNLTEETFIWIESINNTNLLVSNQENFYENKIYVVDDEEGFLENKNYINVKMDTNYNLLETEGSDSERFAYINQDESWLEIVDEQTTNPNEVIIKIKINNSDYIHEDYNNNDYGMRMKFFNIDSPDDILITNLEFMKEKDEWFYYKIPFAKPGNYTTLSIENPLFINSENGTKQPSIDISSENKKSFELDFSVPYLNNFEIDEDTKNSVEFSLTINDTLNQIFYGYLINLNFLINVTLIDTNSKVEEDYDAKFVDKYEYDQTNNSYIYDFKIEGLNKKNDYIFYSINDSYLSISENGGILNNELLLEDDLGISENNLTFNTNLNLLWLWIFLIIFVLVNLLVVIYFIYIKKQEREILRYKEELNRLNKTELSK